MGLGVMIGDQLELFPQKTNRFPALGMISHAPKKNARADLKVTVLQSGSAGNATLVVGGGSAILIDCGLSARKLKPRLEACGLSPAGISAILVTHEHSDHIGGCASFAKQFGTPIYMTEGTLRGAPKAIRHKRVTSQIRILPVKGWLAFKNGQDVDLDPDSADLSIDWVPTSHDGLESVCYAAQRRNFRFGVITDLGKPTPAVERMLSTLDAVSLESNHDVDLLRMSGYPPFVIRRILGPKGHLSNLQAAKLLDQAGSPRLSTVLLAHISERANDRELAFKTICDAAGSRDVLMTEYRDAIDTLEF